MIAQTSAPTYLRPAGFWIRTLAYLIDGFLLSLVGGAFPYLVISTNTAANHAGGAGSSASGGSVFVSLVYFVIFWSHYGGGRTLGMRLIGLRVVREDGSLLSVGHAILRWIGLWISFAVCFIGVLWVAGDARKQGWHDKIANTLVLHT